MGMSELHPFLHGFRRPPASLGNNNNNKLCVVRHSFWFSGTMRPQTPWTHRRGGRRFLVRLSSELKVLKVLKEFIDHRDPHLLGPPLRPDPHPFCNNVLQSGMRLCLERRWATSRPLGLLSLSESASVSSGHPTSLIGGSALTLGKV